MKLTDREKEIIRLIRESDIEWTEPYINFTERGMYVSLTLDDDHDMLVSWKKLTEAVFANYGSGELDDAKIQIQLLERFCARLRNEMAKAIKSDSP